MELKLKAERREATGTGAAHKVRAAGRVPGVLYGHGDDPVHLSVDARELTHLLHTGAGMNVLVTLAVGSERVLAMPRAVQRDYLHGRYLHVDFLRVARDEKVTVEVPVHVVGDSRGVREGGVVEHHLWALQVECLPRDVPAEIEADIGEVGLGESLRVADLALPGGLTVLTSTEEAVVSVVPPQAMRVEAAPEEAVEGEAGPAAEGEAGEAAGDGRES